MNEDEIKKRRLHWKCRRGMLELDILLFNFFEKFYDDLSPEELRLFEELLAQDDVVLYSWFMESEPAADPRMQALINRIGLPTTISTDTYPHK